MRNKYVVLFLFSQLQFQISQLVVSGLKVNRLDMYGEVRHHFVSMTSLMTSSMASIILYS